MEILWVALLFALMLGIPAAIAMKTKQSKKRGCGRGCAYCGNRFICHRSQFKRPSESDNKEAPPANTEAQN